MSQVLHNPITDDHITCLIKHTNIFTWIVEDMSDIDPVSIYHPNILPKYRMIKQSVENWTLVNVLPNFQKKILL